MYLTCLDKRPPGISPHFAASSFYAHLTGLQKICTAEQASLPAVTIRLEACLIPEKKEAEVIPGNIFSIYYNYMFENEKDLLLRINRTTVTKSPGNLYTGNYVPDHLTLQLHITDRCNLKCVHCYIHDRPLPELDIDKLESILVNYLETLGRMNIKGRINVTGGEPFMRSDLFDFLELVHAHRERCSFALLCNGTMINEENAARLKSMECSFVQVSLDGGRKTHDSIRGKGNFVKALAGIGLLKKHGIPVSVSFTAGKRNWMEFGAAAAAARKAGAASIWSDRVIPDRTQGNKIEVLMDDEEVMRYFTQLNITRKKYSAKLFRKTGVSMGRALQFMFYDGKGFDEYPYRCSAGRTVLTVLADGTVAACRRMPVIVGDMKSERLYDIYNNSEFLKMLRNPVNIPDGCGDCSYSHVCNGGLKCLTYAVHGNPFVRDPQCSDLLMNKKINRL